MRNFLLLLLLVAIPGYAQDPSDGPRSAAETYLKALTGQGDDAGKSLLLGGVTMSAQIFTLENWNIVSEDPVRKESGDLASATTQMKELDRAGISSLNKLMQRSSPKGGDDVTVSAISEAEATKVLGPTREKAQRFKKSHPVLAYVARVDKPVYWHPNNPIRPLLAQAKGEGTYKLEVHRYMIETKEGQAQNPRRWPLRVLRFVAGTTDTGWKVLPASDWNGD